MDKFKEMEAFVSAVELGSISRAAQIQGVTPAMLGRRIDALERRLGVKLIQRTTRRLSLTERGELFLASSRKILADTERSEETVSGDRHRMTGHLSIYAPSAFGRLHLLPHADKFLAHHPELTLSFNLTSEPVDLARENYDLGIHIRGRADPSLVAVKLAPNRKVVCGTPDYFRRHGVPLTPYDLLEHNCFPYKTHRDQSRAWTFRYEGKPLALKVNGNIGYNGGDFITHWVLKGLGLGWRSTWEIQPHLDSGELMTVLEAFEPANYDIEAVYAPSQYPSAKIRFFVSELRAIYSEPGYWGRAI